MYKEVIDKLLSMGGVEKERVAINLAKHHPSIFLKMCEEEVKKEPLDNNIVFIINAINDGRRGMLSKAFESIGDMASMSPLRLSRCMMVTMIFSSVMPRRLPLTNSIVLQRRSKVNDFTH